MRAAIRFLARPLVYALAVLSSLARADAQGPGIRAPRDRLCCALAANMPIHFGSAHTPIAIAGVISASGAGWHSYLKDGELTENNGFLYTRRGGFVDLGHARDNADEAAHLALRLRPLLARGEGSLDLGPKGADRRVVMTRAVSPEQLVRTSGLLGIRITFDVSIWTELVQYYGLTKFRAADESYSSMTPDDLYSNLLGAHLGIEALESPVPYDRAMDVALATALHRLGAVSPRETRRVLDRLAGRWWNPTYAWPAAEIAVLRRYEIGPIVPPTLAPADFIAAEGEPVMMDVPETDAQGTPLSDYFRLEIRPRANEMIRFPREEEGKVFGEADFPRLVDEVHSALDAAAENVEAAPNETGVRGGVGHYLNGIRILEVSAELGASGTGDGSGHATNGVAAGALQLVRGDTRGGDFGLMKIAVMHAPDRGLMATFAFFRADALWFCHEPETREVRAPLVSLLGPCASGEWFGIGGSIGEAIHDGKTGRTALRPIALSAVLNPLGNGQSANYDAVRLLLHVGGGVEHVWTEDGGGRTIPRTGGNLSFLLRTASGNLGLHGAAGYRLDPAAPSDTAFESNLALGYDFLVGARNVAGTSARMDPFGVVALELEGSYSYWTRPENAFPEIVAPFVSTEHRGSWQLLVTATLGLEGLSF
jgi:hypothetical protein